MGNVTLKNILPHTYFIYPIITFILPVKGKGNVLFSLFYPFIIFHLYFPFYYKSLLVVIFTPHTSHYHIYPFITIHLYSPYSIIAFIAYFVSFIILLVFHLLLQYLYLAFVFLFWIRGLIFPHKGGRNVMTLSHA